MFRNEESASSEKLSIDTLKEKRSRKSWRKKMSSKMDACKDNLSGNSGASRFHCTEGKWWLSMEFLNAARKFYILTMREKVMSVVSEKNEFENWDRCDVSSFENISPYLKKNNLAFLGYQDSNGGTELMVFQTQYSSERKLFKIANLVDKKTCSYRKKMSLNRPIYRF